jgi:hypothetical protein
MDTLGKSGIGSEEARLSTTARLDRAKISFMFFTALGRKEMRLKGRKKRSLEQSF